MSSVSHSLCHSQMGDSVPVHVAGLIVLRCRQATEVHLFKLQNCTWNKLSFIRLFGEGGGGECLFFFNLCTL